MRPTRSWTSRSRACDQTSPSRAHVDDRRPIGQPKQRQEGVGHPHDPDDVRVEQRECVGAGGILNGDIGSLIPALLISRSREPSRSFVSGTGNGHVVRHVDGHVPRADLIVRGLAALLVASAEHDGVTKADEAAGVSKPRPRLPPVMRVTGIKPVCPGGCIATRDPATVGSAVPPFSRDRSAHSGPQ